MPGGTQSLLVCDEKKKLYTLKYPQNLQGPNVLANEWLGNKVLTALGFHTPQMCPVLVPQNFLPHGNDEFLGLAFEFIENRATRRCFQLLPRSLSFLLANVEDLIGAFVVDLWAGSTDRRQAIYVGSPEPWFTAVLIDNGQLFGGPNWQFDATPGACLSSQPWMYGSGLNEKSFPFWIAEIKTKVLHILPTLLKMIPNSWYSGDIGILHETLIDRALRLEQLLSEELRLLSSRPFVPENHSPALRELVESGHEAFRFRTKETLVTLGG